MSPAPEPLVISSDCVTAEVGRTGAQLARAVFRQDGVTSSPYSQAPWRPGEFPGLPPLLDELAGDFFCLPFGEEPGWSVHGEVAGCGWTVVEQAPDRVVLECEPDDIGGRVTKTVSVVEGEPAIYQEFRVEGVAGEYPYGTHPIIDVSHVGPGGARVSTSPVSHGQVFPGLFSVAERGEVQLLQPGAVFADLAAVPAADGTTMDVSHYPTASGHEDLVMLVNDPSAGTLAWSAVSCPAFVWIALKDARQFPSTVLWLSNGGRSAEPWNGRHVGRVGVEDVCAYFSLGPTASRDNPLRDAGTPTVGSFDPARATVLRSLHVAVVPPRGFGRVATVDASDSSHVTVVDDAGMSIRIPVTWPWVLADPAG